MHQAFRALATVKIRAFAVALSWALAAPVAFAQAPQQIETTMKNMLAAVQAKSLQNFIAAGDASFKQGMTQEMLDGVNAQLAPRLNEGYTSTFIGSLNQQGYIVYLWKVVFKDGKDDRLITMAVKDGKVGGFFLR
jgi:maltoporin